MSLSPIVNLRAARVALAIALMALVILVAVAYAGSQEVVLPVEADGGIGGEVVLPVEPDGGIGN